MAGINNLSGLYLPQNSTGTDNFSFIDNEGSDSDINSATGDSISYSPGVQTSGDGIQAALQASIGKEVLTQFANGAADEQNTSNGTQLSIENGQLYGVGSGSSSRVDLGSASNQSSWQAAQKDGLLSSGKAGQQQEADLKGVYAGGLADAPSVQKHLKEFGVSNSSGLQNIINTLGNATSSFQQAQTQQSQTSSVEQSLEALLQVLDQEIQSIMSGGSSGSGSYTDPMAQLMQSTLQFAQQTASSTTSSGSGV